MLGKVAVLGFLALSLDCCEDFWNGGGGSHPGGDVECGEQIRTLWAGKKYDSGTVTIDNTATDLVVMIEPAPGWSVETWHLYAGPGPIPMTQSGAAIPGQFPYAGTASPNSVVTITIPLSAITPACGETIAVALHADMVERKNGKVKRRETAWADWDTAFPKAWGGGFAYGVCCIDPCANGACEPPPSDECVNYIYYWWFSGEPWPLTTIEVGDQSYTQEEALAIFGMDGQADASVYLAIQVIIAKLNQAAGVTLPPHIAQALADADDWFVDHAHLDSDGDGRVPYGIPHSAPEAADAINLKWELYYFNDGMREVPVCDNEYN